MNAQSVSKNADSVTRELAGTKRVADFVVRTRYDELPRNVVERVKICIMDTLGGALGAHKARSVAILRQFAQELGGKEESSLIGIGAKVPCATAAMVGCTMANFLDVDDTAPHRGLHPGGMVIPPALAVAERENSTGKSFIEAVVVGYEVSLRFAWQVDRAGLFRGSGLHGSFASAATAAKLLGLSREETAHALGIAGHHAPMPEIPRVNEGPMSKGCNGWGALNGVTAALLAQKGFTGASTVVDDAGADKSLLANLGEDYELLNVAFKGHCCCRGLHGAVDGAIGLGQKHSLAAEDILAVKVELSSTSVSNYDWYRPRSVEQAQFSAPFTIASVLVDGKFGPEQSTEDRLSDDVILRLGDKVSVTHNAVLDSPTLNTYPAIVKIEAKGGKNYEIRVDVPKGDPGNPYSHEDLRAKFDSLVIPILGTNTTEKVVEYIENLENLSDLSELIKLLSSATDR
ncbi:MAG: MmgE/PrpD family protein [Dehalococcoidia bacterium]